MSNQIYCSKNLSDLLIKEKFPVIHSVSQLVDETEIKLIKVEDALDYLYCNDIYIYVEVISSEVDSQNKKYKFHCFDNFTLRDYAKEGSNICSTYSKAIISAIDLGRSVLHKKKQKKLFHKRTFSNVVSYEVACGLKDSGYSQDNPKMVYIQEELGYVTGKTDLSSFDYISAPSIFEAMEYIRDTFGTTVTLYPEVYGSGYFDKIYYIWKIASDRGQDIITEEEEEEVNEDNLASLSETLNIALMKALCYIKVKLRAPAINKKKNPKHKNNKISKLCR